MSKRWTRRLGGAHSACALLLNVFDKCKWLEAVES